jgi:gluconate 5-dehydrogenase
MKSFDLSGRTALVTGASRGLGERFALTLAEAGADVIVTSRSLDSLDGIRAKIEALGRRCLPLALDVGSFDSIQSAVR